MILNSGFRAFDSSRRRRARAHARSFNLFCIARTPRDRQDDGITSVQRHAPTRSRSSSCRAVRLARCGWRAQSVAERMKAPPGHDAEQDLRRHVGAGASAAGSATAAGGVTAIRMDRVTGIGRRAQRSRSSHGPAARGRDGAAVAGSRAVKRSSSAGVKAKPARKARMTRAFHLYPVDAADPAWSRTTCRSLCFAVEVNEGAARLPATRTFAQEGVRPNASPWLDPGLSNRAEAAPPGGGPLETGLILWDGRRSE